MIKKVATPSCTEHKTKVGKYEINYVKVGNGNHNVLCAPGALGTIWSEFNHQIEGFNRDKFSLIVWDPPGYGKSYPPEKNFSVDFLEKDADMAYELMKVLQIPKFSLLGFSDGGITSLILAAKYPDAVNKLVVWGANSFILPAELEAYKKIKDVNKWSKRLVEPMIEIYGKERFAKYWANWVDAMDAIYQANNGDICSHQLKNIKCPTYILYGEKDPMVDQVHVSHLHTHIEGSRIHLYPEGKHHIHLKYAEDFNKRVQEFLLQQ
ncbi:valacyclovir hydrolase-like isoform X2 [Pararge aegeria]|uniref:valacyclovir hydrolase-like isoform X2 n=1 Tax=Pararge aegeria TaxID=116150 RepID=UPI0019D03EC2|nr:valacyclovir hydrolase-like isoform X2 [Pararge aegeria]